MQFKLVFYWFTGGPISERYHFENLLKYEQMVEIIQLYKGEQYKEWTDKVDEDCKFNLSQPLLTRNEESNLISVNFNPKLEAVLREVRYSGYIGENEIPESAAKLFERHDQASFKIDRLWILERSYDWVR